jgi:EAL domain-containing protein (putative c-di-GMP-specific phosphodiesterase class I)
VLQTVATENLDPRHLVLGIPETSMTTDVAHSLENLARLRVAGFGLSIEEFGTGHMSLDQLARVAFTELAIHRDFVCNAKRVEPARLGLAIGLDMAKGLGLPAIADGVQSAEDWEFLSQWGCDACQGAFVAPPMPYEDFIQWAASWTQSHPPVAVDSRAAHVALN